jgi:glycosyltransferase involved in cell wall biosynthesis
MKIAFYCPNTFSAIFTKYIKDVEFIFNKCDKSVDLIYSASLSTLRKAMSASQEFNKLIVCWVWDLPDSWRQWQRANKDSYIASSLEMLKKCSLVISASKFTQKTLQKYGIESEQLYFYIDTETINNIKTDCSKKYDAVQISRFYYNKRFEMTILALKDHYKLACVGFGKNYITNLRKIANEKVDFFVDVSREDCIKALKQSKILVSPSVFEGFGLTPIEALYCDIPVLLSDIEVFKEIYGDNIIYHKQDDAKDMKEKFDLLFNDKELQNTIVHNCRQIIAEFEPTKFSKRWRKIIK